MQYLASILSITTITTILLIVLKTIAYLNKSKIERLLFSDEQKIIFHVIRFLGLSIFCSFISLQLIEWLTSDNISNYKDNESELFKIIITTSILGVLLAYVIYWQIVPLFKTISGITNRYFIEHEEHGKLYIVKPANKEQVILYREMDEENVKGMYVFETKERLLSKKIYLEVEKESLIDTIKKLKNSRV